MCQQPQGGHHRPRRARPPCSSGREGSRPRHEAPPSPKPGRPAPGSERLQPESHPPPHTLQPNAIAPGAHRPEKTSKEEVRGGSTSSADVRSLLAALPGSPTGCPSNATFSSAGSLPPAAQNSASSPAGGKESGRGSGSSIAAPPGRTPGALGDSRARALFPPLGRQGSARPTWQGPLGRSCEKPAGPAPRGGRAYVEVVELGFVEAQGTRQLHRG